MTKSKSVTGTTLSHWSSQNLPGPSQALVIIFGNCHCWVGPAGTVIQSIVLFSHCVLKAINTNVTVYVSQKDWQRPMNSIDCAVRTEPDMTNCDLVNRTLTETLKGFPTGGAAANPGGSVVTVCFARATSNRLALANP